jgi:hypothetical protein
MKNTGSLFFFAGLLALAFSLTSGREDKSDQASNNDAENSSADQNSTTEKTKYVPGIPFVTRADHSNLRFKSKPTRAANIASGKNKSQLGFTSGEEEAKGPGAFVYLKERQIFAVLDSENDRLTFVPTTRGAEATSVKFPDSTHGFGITVDNNGQLVLLARKYHSNTKQLYATYEILRLDEQNKKDPWGVKDPKHPVQSFTFDNHQTHGAAQPLEMQVKGDSILFKGLGENEFHELQPGANYTHQLSGFPLSNGNTISLVPLKSENASFIQIKNSWQKNPVPTSEDMWRLASYRVLSNGLVALKLDADTKHDIPREVVLVNPKTGKTTGRLVLDLNDEVKIEQDVSIQDNNVFQLLGKKKTDELATFQINEKEYEEDI